MAGEHCEGCDGSGYVRCCEVDIGVGVQTCTHTCVCEAGKAISAIHVLLEKEGERGTR